MSWWTGQNGTLVQYLTHTVPRAASGYVKSGPVAFQGLLVKTDNVNDVEFSVYDSTSNAGILLIPDAFSVPGTANLWSFSLDLPIMAWTGIYVYMSVAGGGTAKYQVLYDEG